jgi:capsular polysaccharide transport system permease protein
MSRSLKVLETKILPFQGDDTQTAQLESAQTRQRRRARRSWLLALVLVVLPTAAAAVYYGFVATDRYVSHAQLTVKSSGNGGSMTSLDSMLSGFVSDGSNTESYVVQEYTQSSDIMTTLNGWLDLRRSWSSERIDPVSRLDPNATQEDLLDYYRAMVDTTFDPEKSVIDLSVQAYSPEDANALATSIIELSDTLVNEMSSRLRSDALQFARAEVERAEERLQQSRVAMKQFQNEHGDLNPEQTATAIGGIIASIESKLAEVRTEISAKSTYLRDDSPAMKALYAQENALEKQLQRERERLAGTGGRGAGSGDGDRRYSEVLAEYEELRIEEEFARQAYEAAQTALETARVEAARKQLYLVSFVEPTMPQEATRPQRWRNVLVVFLGSLVVFAIVKLIAAAIREHARF